VGAVVTVTAVMGVTGAGVARRLLVIRLG
jgi:hypothetical protein